MGIVVSTRKSNLAILGYLSFFAVEAISKIHPLINGYLKLYPSNNLTEIQAWALAISVAIGTSILHLYTNLLYGKTQSLFLAFMFCTLVHVTFNYFARHMVHMDLLWHVPAAWLFSTLGGIAILLFYAANIKFSNSLH